MVYFKPTEGNVRGVILGGQDITGYIHCVRIYETLCKPYLTVHLTIVDNDNLIENMGIVGGEGCIVSIHSPPNPRFYDCFVCVLSLSGQQSPTNIKTQIYEMELIGPIYFQDKANIVQHSFKSQGTAAIAEIFGKYLSADKLQIHKSSDGMMGKDKEPSTIDHKKPFAAIDQIRGYLKFSPHSPSVFFRDRSHVHLAPLGDLFQEEILFDYIQKETWGIDLLDKDIYRSIIVAQADVDKNFNQEMGGGRAGTAGIAKAGSQGQGVFDLFTGVAEKFKEAASIAGGAFGSGITGLGSLMSINTIAGGLGGSPNIQHTNSNRWDRGNAPDTKAMGEQMFAAEVKNGPQLKLKVPLQSGLEATVGKRITCFLIPPIGDLVNDNMYQNSQSGAWLVKDIVHELYTDKRDVKGTTVMQLVRGGYA